jgi:hypothetical protein
MEVGMSDQPIQRRRFQQGVLVYDFREAKVRCGGTLDRPWMVAKDAGDALQIVDIKERDS